MPAGGSIGSRARPGSRRDIGPAPAASHSLPLRGLLPVRLDVVAILILALMVFAGLTTSEDRGSPAWTGLSGHPLGIEAVTVSSDGRKVATGGYEGNVIVRDLDRCAQATLTGDRLTGVRSLSFSPDGRTIAVGDYEGSVVLWDIATATKRSHLRGHVGMVRCLAFSPDGRTLATGSVGQVRLWDVASGEVRSVLSGHQRLVNVLSFSPDGRSLASGCAGGQIKLWDWSENRGSERASLPEQAGPVQSLVYSPDGALLASGCINERIRLWGVASGLEQRSFDSESGNIHALAIGRSGQSLFAVNYGGRIEVRDVATGRAQATLPGVADMRCAAFSSDGRTLVVGGLDTMIRFWYMDDNHEL
jgi:WD40 repeat protein